MPTSNVEREEEELELPGVPDHQPQVELGYSDQYPSLIDGHVDDVDGLDNDSYQAGKEKKKERVALEAS